MHIRSIGPQPAAPAPVATEARYRRPFTAVLGEQVGPRQPARTPAAPAPTPSPTRPPEMGQAVRGLLERVVATENRVDKLLQAAARGKTFSPSELLALQTSVFRYSQTVEVASRVADRLVGAIKQTVGTSV